MQTQPINPTSKSMRLTGIVLSTLAALFMTMDAVMKLVRPAPVIEASAKLGFSASVLPGIGLVLILCTLLYVIPRTSALGAVLTTAYLGGAVASQVRIGSAWSSLAFPVLFCCLIWGGLCLRNPGLRRLLSLAGDTSHA